MSIPPPAQTCFYSCILPQGVSPPSKLQYQASLLSFIQSTIQTSFPTSPLSLLWFWLSGCPSNQLPKPPKHPPSFVSLKSVLDANLAMPLWLKSPQCSLLPMPSDLTALIRHLRPLGAVACLLFQLHLFCLPASPFLFWHHQTLLSLHLQCFLAFTLLSMPFSLPQLPFSTPHPVSNQL